MRQHDVDSDSINYKNHISLSDLLVISLVSCPYKKLAKFTTITYPKYCHV